MGIVVCVYYPSSLEAKAEEFQAFLGHMERHYTKQNKTKQEAGGRRALEEHTLGVLVSFLFKYLKLDCF